MYFAIGSIPEHDLREILLIVQFGVYLIQFYLLIFFINNHFLYKKIMTFLLQPTILRHVFGEPRASRPIEGALPPPPLQFSTECHYICNMTGITYVYMIYN